MTEKSSEVAFLEAQELDRPGYSRGGGGALDDTPDSNNNVLFSRCAGSHGFVSLLGPKWLVHSSIVI